MSCYGSKKKRGSHRRRIDSAAWTAPLQQHSRANTPSACRRNSGDVQVSSKVVQDQRCTNTSVDNRGQHPTAGLPPARAQLAKSAPSSLRSGTSPRSMRRRSWITAASPPPPTSALKASSDSLCVVIKANLPARTPNQLPLDPRIERIERGLVALDALEAHGDLVRKNRIGITQFDEQVQREFPQVRDGGVKLLLLRQGLPNFPGVPGIRYISFCYGSNKKRRNHTRYRILPLGPPPSQQH